MAILKGPQGPGFMARTGRDLRFVGGILRKQPFQVLVQVTNRCNMRCSFCGFWPNGVAPRLELTVADYQKVAAELAQIGTFLVSVEGGEPLLRPDIVEIVRAFGQHHAPVLYTNGTYVTAEKARALYQAGVTRSTCRSTLPTRRGMTPSAGWMALSSRPGARSTSSRRRRRTAARKCM